jgi:hypothetical protein
MTTVTVDSSLIERPTRYGNSTGYSIAEVIIPNTANVAGSGAGASVTVSIAFSEGNLPTDLSYTIMPSASQACAISWANKAVTGFDIVLTPLTSGATLSSGTFDITVTWSRG